MVHEQRLVVGGGREATEGGSPAPRGGGAAARPLPRGGAPALLRLRLRLLLAEALVAAWLPLRERPVQGARVVGRDDGAVLQAAEGRPAGRGAGALRNHVCLRGRGGARAAPRGRHTPARQAREAGGRRGPLVAPVAAPRPVRQAGGEPRGPRRAAVRGLAALREGDRGGHREGRRPLLGGHAAGGRQDHRHGVHPACRVRHEGGHPRQRHRGLGFRAAPRRDRCLPPAREGPGGPGAQRAGPGGRRAGPAGCGGGRRGGAAGARGQAEAGRQEVGRRRPGHPRDQAPDAGGGAVLRGEGCQARHQGVAPVPGHDPCGDELVAGGGGR
mmetsp:Transcript_111255/g.314933  ORF Transcript_111255/g.314933 Transcript_111255/m.314933 type:complete len:328 (+) Transcript_111255:810-1793(+)